MQLLCALALATAIEAAGLGAAPNLHLRSGSKSKHTHTRKHTHIHTHTLSHTHTHTHPHAHKHTHTHTHTSATDGISSPREATSVATKILQRPPRNLSSDARRRPCFRPCVSINECICECNDFLKHSTTFWNTLLIASRTIHIFHVNARVIFVCRHTCVCVLHIWIHIHMRNQHHFFRATRKNIWLCILHLPVQTHTWLSVCHIYYGVASTSRLLKITGLFCKRAL